MQDNFDPFEETLAPAEPEIIIPKDETPLAMPESVSEEDMKKQAMADVRNALENEWVDLSYIIKWYMDAAENATIESFSWTLLDDHKTKVTALKQLTDLRKASHGMNRKEATEIVFKPIFNKPPKLN